MKKDKRKQVGRLGEELAARFLLQKGYVIRDRNWATRMGELDIIAMKDGQLVIVEVRTTRSAKFGYGLESVDFRKQQKLRRLAVLYLSRHRLHHLPLRFDVISVLWDEKDPQLNHIEGAF
jgi:putative endonuclease